MMFDDPEYYVPDGVDLVGGDGAQQRRAQGNWRNRGRDAGRAQTSRGRYNNRSRSRNPPEGGATWRNNNSRSNTPHRNAGRGNHQGAIRRATSNQNLTTAGRGNARHNFSGFANVFENSSLRQDNNQNNMPGGGARRDRNEFIIGFKFLQQTLAKPSADILIVFSEKKVEFYNFFNKSMTPDFIVLSVKILSKVCETGFDQTKNVILSSVCNSEFIKNLQEFATVLLVQEESQRARYQLYYEDTTAFWLCVIMLFDTIVDLMPNTACDKLNNIIKLCDMTVKLPNAAVDEAVFRRYENLMKKYELCYKERERKLNSPAAQQILYGEPPDSFRTISVYPTSEDILTYDQPFLRPNIKKGAYESVDHYLDVQFRLLREDFICPLREGIVALYDNSSRDRKRNLNVRIYPKVRFISSYITPNVVGLLLDFEADRRKEDGQRIGRSRKINWEHTKKFMFGSLLCFTMDNFQNVIFGTVAERSIDLLKNGNIVVKICEQYADQEQNIIGKDLIMIENEVFFEPYFHVLKALQTLNEDNFPMKEYIVDVQDTSAPPTYIHIRTVYRCDGFAFPVQGLENWPSATQFKLNDSQYRAFQMALTNEFAIIQGPPGTGKTYLGLKVASTLLKNLDDKQMLVVCYTNHALDQFLEGLIPVTENIIRVGSRSKNPAMGQFNLNKIKGRRIRGFNDLRTKIHNLVSRIQGKVKDLEMLNLNDGIIDITHAANLPLQLKDPSWYPSYLKTSFSELVYWLLGFDSHEDIRFEPTEVVTARQQNRNVGNDMENALADLDLDCVDPEDFIDEFDERNALADQDLIFEGITGVSSNLNYAVCHADLNANIKQLQDEEIVLEEALNSPDSDIFYVQISIGELRDTLFEYLQISTKLSTCLKFLDEPQNLNVDYILNRKGAKCSMKERWAIYSYCLNILRANIVKELDNLNMQYRKMFKQYEEQRHFEHLDALGRAKVIGMTTTAAARMRPVLRHLKIPIIVIEEAAEVPESHIVASMTQDCEHLILIGDHQQLKPSTAVYKLAKKFDLDLSLFERMLNNGMHCVRLDVQHRMRPEISRLISPSIYDGLDDHESVFQFPDIKGMKKNLFFLKHTIFEDAPKDGDHTIKKNKHEATFLVMLCRHLILQGYDPEEITILTTYTGQMFLIKQESKSHNILKGVKITTVDNFQGEENKIILLSLVRSNSECNIGFLKIENRVCVALSRAKHGFYIIGNMDNLMSGSQIWPKINAALEDMGAIGTHLVLSCQLHLNVETRVACAKDFNNVSEGGCHKHCMSLLSCGHFCKSICHTNDRQHVDHKCKEPCSRKCKRDHPCQNLCHEPCSECRIIVSKTLSCGHIHKLPCSLERARFECPVIIPTVLPACQHEVARPCYRDASAFPCTYPCDVRLDCGHSCEQKCHATRDPDHILYNCPKPCQRLNKGCREDHACKRLCYEDCMPCTIQEKRKRKGCTHSSVVACAQEIDETPCTEKCSRTLPCGHHCKRKCAEPCGECTVKVEKVIPECGHRIATFCHQEPTRSMCYKKCERKLPCGHDCKSLCKMDCDTDCKILVRSDRITSVCGHPARVPCYLSPMPQSHFTEAELLDNCDAPCGEMLQCQHVCMGTCSQCQQGRIHMSCMQPCGITLVCQHSCKVPCRQQCPPCTEICNYRCGHSKCKRKCGELCVTCKEPCKWQCKHKKCTKNCGEICDRDGCDEPCPMKLRCGHMCIGLCGEKCPELCRVCDNEEVTTIFFGDEDEEHARFVVLEECNHIFEVKGLDSWFKVKNSKEIALNRCPKCTTVINWTPRYSTECKRAYVNIMEVKKKVFGEPEDNKKRMKELNDKIDALINNSAALSKESAVWHKALDYIKGRLDGKNQKKANIMSKVDVHRFDRMYEIMAKIQQIYKNVIESPNGDLASRLPFLSQSNVIVNSFAKVEYNINGQFLDDINRELSRLHWIGELCKIDRSGDYGSIEKTMENVRELFGACKSNIINIVKFTDVVANAVQMKMNELLKIMKSSCVITPEEKRMILMAMDFAKAGHWYTCPNNHIYCITECGGAMETSRCPECKCEIGGSRHRLLDSNRVATEMDGATRPAYGANQEILNEQFLYFD